MESHKFRMKVKYKNTEVEVELEPHFKSPAIQGRIKEKLGLHNFDHITVFVQTISEGGQPIIEHLVGGLRGYYRTAQQLGFDAGTTLHLVSVSEEPTFFQIYIRAPLMRFSTLDTSSDRTILQLKKEYEQISGIPVGLQLMNWVGRYLENDRTIGSYGMGKESTIHLTVLLRGS